MGGSINVEKCKGCTICVKTCPFEVITMVDKKAVIGANCNNCGACVEKCPFGAIEQTEDEKTGVDIRDYHGVWVFAEQREGELMKVAIELLGEGRKLADEIGTELCAVLCRHNVN